MLHNTFYRSFPSDVIRRSIMTSRKARRFRAILAWSFLKIHTFFMKYWYFSELSCDKKNLKWIFITYGIYETSCVFYIPSPKARGYKTHNLFHKYRMKWKFILDPIYIWWVLYIYYRPRPSTATTGGNSWADKVRGASSTTPPKAGSAPLQPSPQPVLPSPPPKQNCHSSDTDGSTTIEGQDFHIIYL